MVSPGQIRNPLVRLATIVWALIPLLTLGLLAFVPFAHAAAKLRNRRLWLVAAVYGVVTVGLFGPLADASNTSDLGAPCSPRPGSRSSWAPPCTRWCSGAASFPHRRSSRRWPPPWPTASGVSRRERSWLAIRRLLGSCASAVLICRAGSTTAAWWTSTTSPTRSWSSGWVCRQWRLIRWSRLVSALAGSAARLSCVPSRRSRTQPSTPSRNACCSWPPTDLMAIVPSLESAPGPFLAA
jgi:hypothetical protein